MMLSNLVVMGTLFQLSLLLSKLKSDQNYLISKLLAVDQNLSAGVNYFDSTVHSKKTEADRSPLNKGLLQSLLKLDRSCINFGLPYEKDPDEAVTADQPDILSEVFSFCLLSGGLILLFKLVYSEYVAYLDMTKEVEKEGLVDKNRISVTIGEFFQYRYRLLSI